MAMWSIVSEVGISPEQVIHNLVCAYSALTILVEERLLDRALILGGVYKMISMLRWVFRCSLRSS
jgi:hypothetical protein